MIQRLIFDTSTLIGAILRRGSVPHQAIEAALDHCEVCTCASALDELERVLKNPKYDHYVDSESRSEFIAHIRRLAQMYPVTQEDIVAVAPSCRDPRDNQFLALALVAQADVIVSSDKDLLVLNPWRRIPILTATEFLMRMGD